MLNGLAPRNGFEAPKVRKNNFKDGLVETVCPSAVLPAAIRR
jgi:hypothetical protein